MAKTKAKDTKVASDNGGSENGAAKSGRLNVLKTYKLYIGGKFPRTESGRYFELRSKKGELVANMCRATRKDFRNSVVAARSAFKGWSTRAHFNRGQILYRIAEMLEGRKAQFVDEMQQMGLSKAAAEKEVLASIDRMVYYAGWCDKYMQVFSSVNPVASSHFNFSMLEPTGVVSIFAPLESPLLGLVSVAAPIIAGGNTCVLLASDRYPLCSISFAEVLNSSDVPGGVVNILTGHREELRDHFSTHMDVNAILVAGEDKEEIQAIQKNATNNVKRVILNKTKNWFSDDAQGPYHILDAQEVKTTWHPIGI